MSRATLTIDLEAVAANWGALDRVSGPGTETAAVVKADAYGLGAPEIARALLEAGARTLFVAQAQEGARLREAVGPAPRILVFEGHMPGEAATIRGARLVPLLNAPEQWARHQAAMPGHPFALQIDTGMRRLGIAPCDWAALRDAALAAGPVMVLSHLACADEPGHPMNAVQLAAFRSMTEGTDAPRSLAATGGTLLGPAYRFDLVRPGIGLYGGRPFAQARPVVRLEAPVIQTCRVAAGESVGYGAAWRAPAPARVATVSAGYADGLIRAMGARARVWAGGVPCPVIGRVSMDLLTIDVTALPEPPESVEILGPHQGIDALAEAAGTIGYEILTALGRRYERRYAALLSATGPDGGHRPA